MPKTRRRPPTTPARSKLPPPPTVMTPTTVIGPNGETVTKRVVSQITAGTHPETAAASAGLDVAEYRRLMQMGAQTRARHLAGGDWYKDFGPTEHEACLFYLDVSKAAKAGESIRRTILEQAARGQLTTTRTVTKVDGQGNTIEVVTTVENEPVDTQSLRWLLERESPSIYGRRAELELVVTDTTDSSFVGDAIATKLAELAAQLTPEDLALPPVIDTTAKDET